MNRMAKALFSGRMLCVFLYGISSGLPLLLIGQTMKAWMKEKNVDLTVIGAFSLTGLPYTLKFLWSPLLDRFTPPFLGRRRGWILIFQLALALLFVALGSLNPSENLWLMGALSLGIAFCAASQDIVIDAYRRDILLENELGLGSSMAINGYRIAMFIAGGGALILADHMPWSAVYYTMAGIMLLGIGINFFSPEPGRVAGSPRTLREAVVMPFVDYFNRAHAFEILTFVLLYKIGDSMASDMFNPLYLDIGFTKTQIGAIAKVFGLWATIGGGLLGGIVMVQIGISRSLWVFGILQMISTLGFSVLAHVGNNVAWLTGVIVFENICTGMASSAYVGFMASLCDKRFTATQFALLSSLMGVPRVILGSSSGYFAKLFGWQGYFLFCGILHIPGMLLLLRQKRWITPTPTADAVSSPHPNPRSA